MLTIPTTQDQIGNGLTNYLFRLIRESVLSGVQWKKTRLSANFHPELQTSKVFYKVSEHFFLNGCLIRPVVGSPQCRVFPCPVGVVWQERYLFYGTVEGLEIVANGGNRLHGMIEAGDDRDAYPHGDLGIAQECFEVSQDPPVGNPGVQAVQI